MTESARAKPREWWIGFWDWKRLEYNNLCGVNIASVESEKTEDCPVNVIEKSAYIELMADAMKLVELIDMLEKYPDAEMQFDILLEAKEEFKRKRGE